MSTPAPIPARRRTRNSQKINLLISLVFHGVIVLLLTYFAAREGLLGKQLKKIAVEMVQEKQPEKPKEPEKPKPEPPKVEPPKIDPPKFAVTPTVPQAPPPTTATPPPVAAPPPVAPPAAEVPSFVFEGGKAVESTADPVQLFKGYLEFTLRSNWNRPTDVADQSFIAEVELNVDPTGRLSNPKWKRNSGNSRWDDSVRSALAATPRLNRTPPKGFPDTILVRFDVQEVTEPILE